MTLIVAAVSAGGGAAVSYGIMKAKVDFVKEAIDKLEKTISERVVFKDACGSCKENWMGQQEDIKGNIRVLNEKLDKVLEAVKGK